MKWFGTAQYGNCLLFALGLWARGRVKRVFRHRGHWLGMTAEGAVIHLKCINKKDSGKWWYLGRPHIIKPEIAKKMFRD